MSGTESSVPLASLAARDRYWRHLGIELVDAGEGHATVQMRVTGAHLNFNGSCHGGAIFSLADSAFGLASNSHGVVATAIDAHLSFNAPVQENELMIAQARERSRGRRIATYGVEVAREDGRLVSVFTGTVYIVGEAHIRL